MLSQMLKELSISSSSSSSIINTIYSRDFDATKLVNIISKASCVFDLLNKDTSIREYSVDSALYALETCGVHVSNFNNVQRAGICIFVQFILCGGRNELEGFGVSTNLVEKWKKNQIVQKKKAQQKILEEQNTVVHHVVVDPEEQDSESMTQEIVPDSWEDL